MAKKYNLTNQRVGKLLIERLCTVEERPSQTHGNYWLCKCDCGNECKVPTSYLTGSGNYLQTSCGCDRKKKAFQQTTQIKVSDAFLNNFIENGAFEKFLLLHHALIRTTKLDVAYYNKHINEYYNIIEYFLNDKQFNAVYHFWKAHEKDNNTYYDWAKPSLDHIIPLSKGGLDTINNYQFLTVFENLSKRDMTMEEWNQFKQNTNTTSEYYIENILINY